MDNFSLFSKASVAKDLGLIVCFLLYLKPVCNVNILEMCL